MKLGVAVATQIAPFICGDEGLPFPYRTGRQISHFFTALGHGYRIDDYPSRGNMAENALIEIDNETSDADSHSLSPQIVEILEELMSPSHFDGRPESEANFDKALKAINRVLERINFRIQMVNNVPRVESLDGVIVSTSEKSIKAVTKLVFAPSVFEVPESPEPQTDLVSVMMPFDPRFEDVFRSIKTTCDEMDLRCFRVKDIWKESQIIQDIFELILASRIVVVDFSDANTNVFYEAGIAHTLGKEVVPLAQSVKHDVPFDLQSHRVIEYLANDEGLAKLSSKLKRRFETIVHGHDWSSIPTDDENPF